MCGQGRGPFQEDEHGEFAAEVDHAGIEDVSAPGVDVGGELADDSGAIGANSGNDELGH